MPVLFVGHGSPMNAVEDNPWSRGFRALGRRLPRPRAILAVSAHWFVDGIFLTEDERPRTIHDFAGFPPSLYRIVYPAPGDPGLARRAAALLGEEAKAARGLWGLDHGTWTVLLHLFPEADVPVVQLSLDGRRSPREHFALAGRLAPLRDEGVLLLGSGNATHNLRDAVARARRGETEPPDWARRFDTALARALVERDADALTETLPFSEDGRRAHPSLDHYLPVLYAAAVATEADEVSFPLEGFDWGSLSMRTVLWEPGGGR